MDFSLIARTAVCTVCRAVWFLFLDPEMRILSDVYGDICPHAAHVARSIPGYTQPFAKDVSVVWTTMYSHYGLNENQAKNMTSKRQKEKEIGLHIDPLLVSKVPYNISVLDFFTKAKDNVLCYNYDFLPESAEADFNNSDLLSESNIDKCKTCEFKETLKSHSTVEDAMCTELPSLSSNYVDPWCFFIQSFKEMVNHYQNNCNMEDLFEVNRFSTKKWLMLNG